MRAKADTCYKFALVLQRGGSPICCYRISVLKPRAPGTRPGEAANVEVQAIALQWMKRGEGDGRADAPV
jgi:hypothetical protein